MGAFLRRIVETHTEMTEFLLSVAKRGAYPRYLRGRDRSDTEVVMSDLATTISDLGTASARMMKNQSATRDLEPMGRRVRRRTDRVAEQRPWG